MTKTLDPKGLEALARAYDGEEAACMGEPSPWVSADAENGETGERRPYYNPLHTNAADLIEALASRSPNETLERAAKAGWNACRKSIYAVCEDVEAEADRIRTTLSVGTAAEEQHAKGYHAGTCRAAKSIARGFNSMEAEDDDNFAAAIRAMKEPENG